jgi:pimeloyl-ACP methyl ester carboxylesterase
MRHVSLSVQGVPAILLGDTSDKVYIFVHGQGGCKEEAENFAAIAAPCGWQVLAADLPEHGGRDDGKRLLPWVVVPELQNVLQYAQGNWGRVSVRATSIGAWFSMLAYAGGSIEKCLFVSPVLDMEKLIEGMMRQSNVTAERLQREKEVPVGFGQTLSWDYLAYVRQHPICSWDIQTEILHGEHDVMTSAGAADAFAFRFGCGLTRMKGGEHWFHTDEQLRVMADWEEAHI